MVNKSSPELTLTFLLMTTLCLDAVIQRVLVFSSKRMNWTEARLHCQNNYIDLVTLSITNRSQLAAGMMDYNIKELWVGILRDPENDSVWKWINRITGEGISGENVSQSSIWADEQQDRHCAFVLSRDRMWHSARCSSENEFYCSVGDKVIYDKTALSWYNASLYCQNKTSNLVTVTETNKNDLDENGWIGLYQEAGETWSWIGNLSSDYRNWAPEEPLKRDCGSLDSCTAKLHRTACSKRLPTVCYADNLVLVNENKTWEDAVKHCLKMESTCFDTMEPCNYSHNLLSLKYWSLYNYVRDRIYRATTDEIWTGLRFLAGKWMWVNGEKLEDQRMLPDCPAQGKHCGTLSKYDKNMWITRNCSERRNFVCYRVRH